MFTVFILSNIHLASTLHYTVPIDYMCEMLTALTSKIINFRDIEHHHPAPIVWFPVATIPDIREEVEVIQDPSVLDPLRIAVIQEEDRGSSF